jgi:hypothetical protein
MKSFLYHTLIFAFAILILLGAAEYYVRSLPNPSRDKHAWMLKHSKEVRTLVLGSSQTFYGVNPAFLGEGAYFLAQVSQTYRYDCYLLQHYPFPHLRYVILPFSFFSLYEDFESQNDYTYVVRYRLYMDCDLHSRLSKAGFECLQKSAFLEKLKSLWKRPQLEWDRNTGFGVYRFENRKKEWNDASLKIKKDTYEKLQYMDLNEAYLNEILQFCARRDIKVLWITPPVSRSYYKLENARQKSQNRKVMKQILKRWNDVIYLDFEQDKRFKGEDFYDATHLNTKGAEKLACLLRPYLK